MIYIQSLKRPCLLLTTTADIKYRKTVFRMYFLNFDIFSTENCSNTTIWCIARELSYKERKKK